MQKSSNKVSDGSQTYKMRKLARMLQPTKQSNVLSYEPVVYKTKPLSDYPKIGMLENESHPQTEEEIKEGYAAFKDFYFERSERRDQIGALYEQMEEREKRMEREGEYTKKLHAIKGPVCDAILGKLKDLMEGAQPACEMTDRDNIIYDRYVNYLFTQDVKDLKKLKVWLDLQYRRCMKAYKEAILAPEAHKAQLKQFQQVVEEIHKRVLPDPEDIDYALYPESLHDVSSDSEGPEESWSDSNSRTYSTTAQSSSSITGETEEPSYSGSVSVSLGSVASSSGSIVEMSATAAHPEMSVTVSSQPSCEEAYELCQSSDAADQPGMHRANMFSRDVNPLEGPIKRSNSPSTGRITTDDESSDSIRFTSSGSEESVTVTEFQSKTSWSEGSEHSESPETVSEFGSDSDSDSKGPECSHTHTPTEVRRRLAVLNRLAELARA